MKNSPDLTASENILQAAEEILGSTGRVRIWVPGGAIEVFAIENVDGQLVNLKLAPDRWASFKIEAISGYEELL